jgi:hypothetical protein
MSFQAKVEYQEDDCAYQEHCSGSVRSEHPKTLLHSKKTRQKQFGRICVLSYWNVIRSCFESLYYQTW